MTNNLPEPDDAPWLNLTPQEVEELRYNKQELTKYGREKIRALMLKSQNKMKETDISKVLIEGDTATIMGVKYKRVEKPMSRFTENPDEIVLEDVKMFHLESMNERTLWVGVYTQNGKTYHLNISANGDKLKYWWSDETCDH